MIRSTMRKLAAGVALLAATGGLLAGVERPAAAMPAAPPATTGDVSIGVDPIDDSSAGSSYVDLTYINVSDHDVALHGWAGLSAVAHHDGAQVGRPAGWLTDRGPVAVTLQPGGRTTEIVSIADPAVYGPTSRHTVRADGFRVYLPGSRSALFVPYVFTATTRDVTQLQVDPIGARI